MNVINCLEIATQELYSEDALLNSSTAVDYTMNHKFLSSFNNVFLMAIEGLAL